MNARIFSIATVSLTVLVAGCGGAGPTPETNYYRLADPTNVAALATPATQRPVVVKVPRATGVRNERNMLYSDDPNAVNLKQYHQHYWEESPSNMVQAWMIDYLRMRNLSATVVRRSSSGDRVTISSWLTRFERILSEGERNVIVAMEFHVDVSGRSEPLHIGEYRSVQSVGRSDMEGTALAFSAALNDIMKRFDADVEGALEGLD
jgi:ABC-type uncharacterized transport system auxiliary subunit